MARSEQKVPKRQEVPKNRLSQREFCLSVLHRSSFLSFLPAVRVTIWREACLLEGLGVLTARSKGRIGFVSRKENRKVPRTRKLNKSLI